MQSNCKCWKLIIVVKICIYSGNIFDYICHIFTKLCVKAVVYKLLNPVLYQYIRYGRTFSAFEEHIPHLRNLRTTAAHSCFLHQKQYLDCMTLFSMWRCKNQNSEYIKEPIMSFYEMVVECNETWQNLESEDLMEWRWTKWEGY